MFDIGWSELLVIGVVALLVVGPKELPALLRTIGRYVGMIKRQANEFRAQFDEAMRETEFDQLRKEVASLKSEAETSLRSAEQSVKSELDDAKSELDSISAAAKPDSKPADGAVAALPEPAAAPSEPPAHVNGSTTAANGYNGQATEQAHDTGESRAAKGGT